MSVLWRRRNLVIAASSLGLGVAGPSSAEVCRVRGRRSVTGCAEGCRGLEDTVECQHGVLFPQPGSGGLGRILAGAVLGGVIAYAAGGDIVSGVLIGGVVGGIERSTAAYLNFHLGQANNNVYRAFESAVEFKDGDEYRLLQFRISDLVEDVARRYADVAAAMGDASPGSVEVSRLSADVRANLRHLDAARSLTMSSVVDAAQTSDITQATTGRLGQMSGRPAPPKNEELADHEALRRDRASSIATLNERLRTALNGAL